MEEIEKVIGKVRVELNESSNPRSPGMLKSHYAPKKKLRIIEDKDMGALAHSDIGVIGFNVLIDGVPEANQILLSQSGNLSEAAKNLFAAMRKLDNSSVSEIVAVKFPETGLGRAINDRLKRAATE
jgi:L-threonylcarbamoyladenylate synthase